MTHTRRQFLTSSLAAGAAITAASTATAIEPIKRPGKSHMKLSIAAYSYNGLLNLKAKPKPAMTLDDFVDLAADMYTDAVELTAYYFAETTPEYLAHLKGKCTRLGLDVSGTAVGNNFCLADADKLKEQMAMVKSWVEHTSRLGGKTIRIFAGNVDKGDTEENALKRCVASIEEACEYAGKYGIYLAIENHGGITSTPEQLLKIVKAVKSPWFGVNLDTGNFHGEDPYADLAQAAPYAVTVQVKTEITRKGQKEKEDADLAKEIEILRKVNYRGYVALEYEAKEDPRTAVPKHIATLRKLIS